MNDMVNTGGEQPSQRKSNLELYRILLMLAIVAHHYVVNSGLMTEINQSSSLQFNSIFLLLFGCWGKIGINCFVLITGYFMCTSSITPRKFIRLFLEIVFYNVVIYLTFVVSGYQSFRLMEAFRTLIPFMNLTTGFSPCFLVFYLFIPFLNLLIHSMNEKRHRYLVVLLLGVFSVWASIPFVEVGSSYVFWFMILYIVASYIRMYPIPLFENSEFWGWTSLVAIVCALVSILFVTSTGLGHYYFLQDCNKITALAVALCFFLYFKNLKIKYSKTINTIAASTFGVLCIHANSDTMRQWLWKEVFNNTGFFHSPYLVFHAIGVVVIVFAVCTVLDQLRIRLIEKPLFKCLDHYKWIHREIS